MPSKLPEPMTLAELRALPAILDFATAADALRTPYATAYRLRRERKFPLTPLPHSSRYNPLYSLADLLRYLGFDPATAASIPADATRGAA